ncbi:ROK family transcriptional regulator [uncultured Tessaracoccus sp.]|uniref:ROK family transcriptional regulator n=1 Tax=uncultured Tessaracoccus sp. TaxID=905023 RepID=UPI0025D820AC|nr:ROK family transcriptional regulator [uncultured Tessaracoccus sp.]
MRSSNLSVVLRQLRHGERRSRAQLATATRLSKASITSLVAELTARGLVREGEVERRGTIGRPGTCVELDGSMIWGIGLEINVEYLAVTVVDLTGAILDESSRTLAAADTTPEVVLDQCAAMLNAVLGRASRSDVQVAGIVVAPPGIIDHETGTVRFAPSLGWRDVPLAALLSQRLRAPDVPLQLENDAKLAALASFATLTDRDDVRDLVHITGDVGVGAGIIADGHLMRGWSGFSGEVGHMLYVHDGPPCPCGRNGCWELYVGVNALLAAVPDDDPANDLSLPFPERLQALRDRLDGGDDALAAALRDVEKALARGLTVVVDFLNPRRLVLGGYFAWFPEVLAGVEEALEARRMDVGMHVEVTLSPKGFVAAPLGGALLALDRVFADPTVAAERPHVTN